MSIDSDYSSPKIKWSTNRSSTFQVSPERTVLDLVSQAMGGLGSSPTRGNILLLGFLFHSVKIPFVKKTVCVYNCMLMKDL